MINLLYYVEEIFYIFVKKKFIYAASMINFCSKAIRVYNSCQVDFGSKNSVFTFKFQYVLL